MQDYTLSLHGHSVYSQRDAIIKLDQASEKIKAAGCTHYALTDHGTIQGWLALRDACKKTGLIPVYGCEVYVNDSLPLIDLILAARDAAAKKDRTQAVVRTFKENALRFISKKQAEYICDGMKEMSLADQSKNLLIRLRFGYGHLVCVAISEEGRRNLIKIVNRGWTHGHHYKPQVTTDDMLARSDGIIFTSACLVSPLARRLRWDESGQEGLEYIKRWDAVKDQMYLEVLPLDLLPQRKYNEYIINLARQTGHKLILNQDNHHLERDEWMAHRVMMLAQESQPIEAIEAFYEVAGEPEPIPFSVLKRKLGFKATWQVQQHIEQEGLVVARPAGHRYGDISLHWRTNEVVRQEVEITNPELIPVLDECFETSRMFCETIPEVKWSETIRMPRHENAREKVLRVCVAQLEKMDLVRKDFEANTRGVRVMSDDTIRDALNKPKKYLDWFKREDRIINACGFYDYLWTLYLWTKRVQEEGIPIGYARGSGGGCLIMYLLGIIRVDPVKYGLYFDRFLNPARLGLDPNTLEQIEKMSSVPDVDLDFSSIHRDRVIEIAKELFGEDYVVPVGTITELRFKSALADLCRVLGISQQDFMPISKELPDDVTEKLTMERAMEVQAFKEFAKKHVLIEKFLPPLVGTMKATGKHAGGVCIADVPIAESIPVVRSGSKEGGGIVTGFGESGGNRALESIGFIKFDALATDTVDHLSLCAKLRYEEHLKEGGEPWIQEGEKFLYPEQMPDFGEDDPAVMQGVFHSGDTDGIFQMEENIGKSLCSLIKPDNIDEISDISTMIRPGCLQAPAEFNEPHPTKEGKWYRRKTTGLHLQYAAFKFNGHGNAPPELPAPILEVLEPTHYCCIYQEQMMWLIEVLSGGKVSLGEGDVYRRNIELWGKQKEGAKEKCEAIEQKVKDIQAYPVDIVDKTCEIIKGGANYSFNKAHSLSYSLFSYGQAWFKHYFPQIFYAAHVTLLAAKNKLDKVHKIINNARSRGIEIRSPHVGHSSDRASWSDDGKIIYLPITIMKGFKKETPQAIFECGQGCQTVEDFLVKAIPNKAVKKNHAIGLAKVGALDDLGLERLQVLGMVSYVWARSTAKTKESVIRKYCEEARQFYPLAKISRDCALQYELDVFGGFINESPLDRVEGWLTEDGWTPLSQIEALEEEYQKVFFLITSIQKKIHKSGNNQGKEWFKLICWDGQEVCELCIWNYDLDGTEKRIGYRPLVQVHKVYKAYVQWDGNRPCSLAHRSWLPPGSEALYSVPTDMGVRD